MINYNPEQHYDKLVNHIAEAYLSGAELDQPLMPHKNNGEPNYALYDGEELYLFTDTKLHKQLFIDAFQKFVEFLHSTDQEPKNVRTSIGCGIFDPDPETARLEVLRKAFSPDKGLVDETTDMATRQLEQLWDKLYGHIIPKEESSS